MPGIHTLYFLVSPQAHILDRFLHPDRSLLVRLQELFDIIDEDGSGSISLTEYKNKCEGDTEILELWPEFRDHARRVWGDAKNRNREISREEFLEHAQSILDADAAKGRQQLTFLLRLRC